MFNTRKAMLLLLIACLSLGLGACSSTSSPNSPAAGSNNQTTSNLPTDGIPDGYVLPIGANSLTGTFYQFTVASCDLVDKYAAGWSAVPITTGGSPDTFALMDKGEVAVCAPGGVSLGCAINGTFGYDHPYTGLKAWAVTAPEYWHIYTTADSSYSSLADLAGKKVSIGTPGSGYYLCATALLDALGIDPETYFDLQYVSPDNAVSALQDGSLDAMFQLVGLGGYPAQVAESRRGIKLIQLTDDELNTIIEAFPYAKITEIPSGYYKGVDEAVKVIGDYAVIVSYDDVPENVVYQYVRLINEYHSDIEMVNQECFANATAQTTVDEWYGVIDFHPGAEKYYREIGIID